ncbi:hypothetical protein NEUTE1DRAFT_114168 [Neurospora tetrasperma FGSC 2508]|uniref:Uncharacterized protein n=1 Tax=Neurospora tetrasperma (strain FGSC 2508 / ATCC MYA-4615 / P0657) TaxID=510951 RepID=F8N0M7_NEUT8|nr:uncharacterized protein NEUTE1DRAFT_114168 [Neurospora tetrasperma FGSC 2508]EGO52167.1 hypothetical protein NEUTE1DRAFT_114168 [Neurospora tetrasperma FGSC 2508]
MIIIIIIIIAIHPERQGTLHQEGEHKISSSSCGSSVYLRFKCQTVNLVVITSWQQYIGRSNSNGCGPALAINPSPSHRALRRAGRPRQSATENHRLRIYLSRLSIERQATYLGICQCIENDNGVTRGVRVTRKPVTVTVAVAVAKLTIAPLSAKPRWEMGLETKHGDGQTELTSHLESPTHNPPKMDCQPPRTFQGLMVSAQTRSSVSVQNGPSPGVIDRESMTRRTGFHLLRIRVQPVRVAVLWTNLQLSP